VVKFNRKRAGEKAVSIIYIVYRVLLREALNEGSPQKVSNCLEKGSTYLKHVSTWGGEALAQLPREAVVPHPWRH